jgi:ribosomal protein S18 acetylase RimI-like enzyme
MLPNDINRLRETVALSFSKFMGFFAVHSLLSADGQTIVADVQGAAVGFAKLTEFQIGACKFSCVLWIGVHPEFRGRGIASSLVNAGVKRLKEAGAKKVFASSQRRNVVAHTVLRRSGFRSVGFLELWAIFAGRIFEFYSAIWLAPGEVIFIHE